MHRDRVEAQLWPFRPLPIREEDFASWFSRVAWKNDLTPSELYQVVLPGGRLFRMDLDRFVSSDLIANLSQHTDIPAKDLHRRTLHHWAGRLFEEDDGRGKLLWLPPAGTQQGSKSFGQQACPRCLAEAGTPYLDRIWRLAFITACPQHWSLLIDRCPECSAPIQPLYGSAQAGSVCICWSCGFDLRKADQPSTVSPENMAIQDELFKIAEGGWAPLSEYGTIYSLAYFRILWLIYRLLATGRFALPLREHIGGGIPSSGIPRIKEIERLNPRCRQVLVRMAHGLMRDWPHRFIDACKHVGLSTRVLVKDHSRVPFAYWDPIARHLNEPSREITPEEIEGAKAYLGRRGVHPTYRALTELLETRFQAHRNLAEPEPGHRPYGTHRYWKLDGISPEVRSAAKAAARKNGENLGSWVDSELRKTLKGKNLI